jgi:hypothetical protein
VISLIKEPAALGLEFQRLVGDAERYAITHLQTVACFGPNHQYERTLAAKHQVNVTGRE